MKFRKKDRLRIFNYGEIKKNEVYGPPIHPKDWMEKREKHYEKFLGKISDKVLHDNTNSLPHIDVYEILPDKKRGRDFSTIITSGMSNAIQTLPKELSEKDGGRFEILWYVKNPEIWMFDFLIPLAKVPFQYKSFYWYFHTIENGFPAKYKKSKLNHITFLPPVFEEKDFKEGLILDKIPVHFLWLVPISKEEMTYKLGNGQEAMARLIAEKNLPRIFDPYRKSMI